MAKKTEYTKTNNYKDLPSEYGKVPPQAGTWRKLYWGL